MRSPGSREGGVLGLTLLLDRWFSISPSVSGAILNVLCYGLGWKLLGKRFLAYSFLSTVSFSLSYKLYEQFSPALAGNRELPASGGHLWAQFSSAWARACACGQAARRAETTLWP